MARSGTAWWRPCRSAAVAWGPLSEVERFLAYANEADRDGRPSAGVEQLARQQLGVA